MIRKVAFCIALLSIGFCIASCHSGGSQTSSTDRPTMAKDVITSLSKADYQGAKRDFNSKMNSVLTDDELKKIWPGLTANCGEFKGFGSTRTGKEQGLDELFLQCSFQRGTAEIRFVFDGDNKIGGMWVNSFTPASGNK